MLATLDDQRKEYQRKVDLLEKQILQRDTDILDLSKVEDGLSMKLSETTNLLRNKEAGILQSLAG